MAKFNLAVCLIIAIGLLGDVKGQHAKAPRSIAIIGGGIGGTSASYFIREKFGEDVNIDLYEKEPRLCGRLATVNIGGRKYESGGSIIHPKNKYMKEFAKKFGLQEADDVDCTMEVFDGKEYVFQSSSWSIITLLKMIWTFGFSLFRLRGVESKFMNNFLSIYDLQDQGHSYDDVTSLLHAMGGDEFVESTKMTSEELFKSHGISDFMINNLITPALRTNYGQDSRVNGFVGTVSMAGIQSGLWSVKGGNELLCQKLVENSNATVIQEDVSSVLFNKNSENGMFSVLTRNRSEAVSYDIVIVAAPVRRDMHHIDLSGACEDKSTCPTLGDDGRRYKRTVANFVKGKLNSSLFNCDTVKDCPGGILVSSLDTYYRSIGLHVPVDYDPHVDPVDGVYKVFTTHPMTEDQINYLFESHQDTATVDWKAYPRYRPPEELGTFVLNHHGLYYTSPIEWAASAMEMSAVSAKNAAILAYNYWFPKVQEDVMSSHPEL